MDDYQQALMAMGAETMARLRRERDEWKAKYEELLNERRGPAVPGRPFEGDTP